MATKKTNQRTAQGRQVLKAMQTKSTANLKKGAKLLHSDAKAKLAGINAEMKQIRKAAKLADLERTKAARAKAPELPDNRAACYSFMAWWARTVGVLNQLDNQFGPIYEELRNPGSFLHEFVDAERLQDMLHELSAKIGDMLIPPFKEDSPIIDPLEGIKEFRKQLGYAKA